MVLHVFIQATHVVASCNNLLLFFKFKWSMEISIIGSPNIHLKAIFYTMPTMAISFINLPKIHIKAIVYV